MSLRRRLALRILWVLFGLAAVCGILMTVSGFGGGLSPVLAGVGWLLLSFHMGFWLFEDVLRTIGLALDIRDGGK